MNNECFFHIPVLLDNVLDVFDKNMPNPKRMIDGTIGGGGHSEALLKKYPQLEILAIDCDSFALENAAKKLAFAKDRVHFYQGNYAQMKEFSCQENWDKVDAILLDIGVSSPQLDLAERGFSWRQEGPLDMRMNRLNELNASRILNKSSEEELEKIFRNYGEIKSAKKLAHGIVERRKVEPFALTSQLVTACDEILGRSRPGKLPIPTLVFQALRIAVNDELEVLKSVLPDTVDLLNVDGIVAVISFHSLEDRIVKNFFKDMSTQCKCPPGLPVCICNNVAKLKNITNKPLTASSEELKENRRAASAKLRVAKKI